MSSPAVAKSLSFSCPQCFSPIIVLAANCQVIAFADGSARAHGKGFDWLPEAPAVCSRCTWIGTAAEGEGHDVCEICHRPRGAHMRLTAGENLIHIGCEHQSVCDNCGLQSPDSGLNPIQDLSSRVAPGCEVPSGECPTCGCLCYPLIGRSL